MNSIYLVGRLVKDPEVKSVGDKTVTSYRIAVGRKYGDKSDFFNCSYWNDNFISQFAKRGTMVSVIGEAQINEKDGIYYTTVVVEHSKILADGISKKTSEPNVSFESFDTFEELNEQDIQGLFDKI